MYKINFVEYKIFLVLALLFDSPLGTPDTSTTPGSLDMVMSQLKEFKITLLSMKNLNICMSNLSQTFSEKKDLDHNIQSFH